MRIRDCFVGIIASSFSSIINNNIMPGQKKVLLSAKSPAKAGIKKHCDSDCACDGPSRPSSSRSPKDMGIELLNVVVPSLSELQEHETDQIVFVHELSSLKRIMDDKTNMVVWRQESPPKFVEALADPSIEPEHLPQFEGLVPAFPGLVAEAMKKYLWVPYSLRSHKKRKQTLDEEGVDELVHHIDKLVQVFTEVSKESGFLGELDKDEMPFVNIKLHAIKDNGCKFWHQDCVPFRLCTTFRGPCTEYVTPKFSRSTLALRQFDSEHANSLSHCDVALFKGRGDADSTQLYDQPGIVHRSPRTQGVCRLLLVIDIPQEGWHYDSE